MTRRCRWMIGFVAVLLVASACGSDDSDDSSGSDAGDAATLTVLCTVDEPWCEAQTAAFTEETGIETTYVRLSGGDALDAVTGTDAPEYSVWWGGSADGYVAAKDAGRLARYVSPNAADVPAGSKDPDGSWTGIYLGALGFCSNADELAAANLPAPDSWSDLLDPALAGRVSIAHPASSGTASTALWTLMTLNGLDEEATFAYLEALDANVAEYTASGSAPVEEAAAGDATVAVVFAHDCVAAIADGADDLVLSFPAEGTGSEIGATAILEGGPDREAAERWIDWVLTAEAQEIGATAGAFQQPVNPDATVSELSVDLGEIALVDYDFVEAGRQRDALTERFTTSVAPAPPDEG